MDSHRLARQRHRQRERSATRSPGVPTDHQMKEFIDDVADKAEDLVDKVKDAVHKD